MKRKMTWILPVFSLAVLAACGGTPAGETVPRDVNNGGSAALSVDFAVLSEEGEWFVQGVVFNDVNRNGVMDTCEPGIDGVTVQLENMDKEVIGDYLTSAGGAYSFAVSAGESYWVVETDLPGYASLTDAYFLDAIGGNETVNFADETLVQSYSICGVVFEDLNGSGMMDAEELGINGITVMLSGIDDRVTDAMGLYAFAVTTTDIYWVDVTVPDGYRLTTSSPVQVDVPPGDDMADFGLRPYIVVPVDVKPDSDVNPVNLKSNGVLPVAIFGSEELDVTTIDPVTLLLNGVAPLRWSYEDICGETDGEFLALPDGWDDLSLKFETQEIVASLGDGLAKGNIVTLYLSGELYDGMALEGSEQILIVQVPKE